MGRAVNFTSFEENTKKETMLAHSARYAERNVDREENPSGDYHNWWKMHKDEILDSKEEAEEYLESFGAYEDGCVRYRVMAKTSKKYEELIARQNELKQKKGEYNNANNVKNRKSELIGCPHCKSKIARAFIWNNFCPVCRTDLRSDTVKNRLKGYDEKIKELDKKIKEEEKKQTQKKPKIMWLVKTEVRC